MQFTPGQLRNTVGLSIEAYRHWKRVLPLFANRKNYAPCFSIGDLLAASILRRLTDGCGVRIGCLVKISTEIIRLCNTVSWASLSGCTLVVDLPNETCRLTESASDQTTRDIVVLCPLDPIVAELRDALLRSLPPANQTHFLFPPTSIRYNSRARRNRA